MWQCLGLQQSRDLSCLDHFSLSTVVFFSIDCKTDGFFLKISSEIGKAWRKSLTRAQRASLTRPTGVERKKAVSPQSRSLFSASFQTFCLTARAYLNTQKYGLFCSLSFNFNKQN